MSNQVVLIIGSLGMIVLGTAVITFVYLYQRKLLKRKIAFQKIEDLLKRQELRSAYALLEGQDTERQRVAEEIHDNLGSVLVTLAMYSDLIQRSPASNEHENLARKIGEITRQASEIVRKISHRLDSGALRHVGFKAAVHDLLEAVTASGSIRISYSLVLDAELTNDVSLNLYRIIQELIHNTLKHARATNISVDISQVNDEYISFIYEDDGVGFDQEAKKKSKGMGMRNILARVEKLQGQVSFERKPTSGFSAVFEIPIQEV